jgi:hypothetical protein
LKERCAADPLATVIVFYSGHGGFRQGDGKYFLVPHGFTWEDFELTAIAADTFIAAVQAIKARRLLVLLDCCHASAFADAKSFIKSIPPSDSMQELGRGEGRAVIASSGANEQSYTGTPYSVFTAALLEGLAGYGSVRRDGVAELLDVLGWVRDRVPVRTQGKQNPRLNSESLTLSFPLAFYAGGQDEPKALSWSNSSLNRTVPSPEIDLPDTAKLLDYLRTMDAAQFRTVLTLLNVLPADLEGRSQTERANSLLFLQQQEPAGIGIVELFNAIKRVHLFFTRSHTSDPPRAHREP